MDLVLELKVREHLQIFMGNVVFNEVKNNYLFLLNFLQNNASKLLLAIMESRHDSENAERILYNMRPKELVNANNECTC